MHSPLEYEASKEDMSINIKDVQKHTLLLAGAINHQNAGLPISI